MARRDITGSGERGAAIVEFAIVGTLFFTMLFGIIEFGRLLWIHNELTRATRRAARYAVTHGDAGFGNAKNVAVYGRADAGGTARPIIPDLTVGDVTVTGSSEYGINVGTVTVTIDYQFSYVVRLIGTYVQMPTYQTVLPAESGGCENFANPANPCALS